MKEKALLSRGEKLFFGMGILALFLIVVLARMFAVPYLPEETEEPVPLEEVVSVDINHADVEALCSLPGVEKKTAQALIDYREKRGAFRTVREAARVRGLDASVVKEWTNLAYAG